jgi:hypothetical protein
VAIVDVVENGQTRVNDLRAEPEQGAHALDRTDDVLEKTDGALVKAESVLNTGRRWAPRILVAGVALAAVGTVVVVGGVVFVVVRRRRGRTAADD